jgi:hypothetical protein
LPPGTKEALEERVYDKFMGRVGNGEWWCYNLNVV